MTTEMNLAYRILDDQLVDVDGRRCGRVDDLLLTGEPGQPLVVEAILSGSGVWHRRLPGRLRRLSQYLFGSGVIGKDIIQVPWAQVDHIDDVVHLRAKAPELGLGQGDDRDAALFRRVPGA
jgi:sporulation protein YlmC with PRC-barrel domain